MSNDDIGIYAAMAARYKLLGKDEQRGLIALAQKGDDRAKSKLIKHNISLVISIAKKYVGQGLDFEELIQEGQIGLTRSYRKIRFK